VLQCPPKYKYVMFVHDSKPRDQANPDIDEFGQYHGFQLKNPPFNLKVWTAFATLIERAHEDGVDYQAALAAHHRTSTKQYVALEADFKTTVDFCQAQVDVVQAEVAEQRSLLEDQKRQTSRWELLAKQVTAERDEKIKEVQAAEAAHFAETQARERVERKLKEEQNAALPLQKAAEQLAAAKSEISQMKAIAKKTAAELSAALEEGKKLTAHVIHAELSVKLLKAEMRTMEVAHVKAVEVIEKVQEEAEEVKEKLEVVEVKVVEMKEVEVEQKKVFKDKMWKLMRQMTQVEEKAVEKEDRSSEIQAELDAANESIRELEAQIAALQTGLEAERQVVKETKEEQKQALSEAGSVQTQSTKVIEEMGKYREESKKAREEYDELKLNAFRDADALRSQVDELTAQAAAATAEAEEARETYRVLQERVAKLEEEANQMRLSAADREVAHQEHLAEKEKQASLERKASEEHAAHELSHAHEDAQVLREALESFHTLFEAFDAMREEVKRLTTDNEMYALEMTRYEEELNCVYELRSTCAVADTVGFVLEDPFNEAITEQLALQCEQQRAIDATERDLAEAFRKLESLSDFCALELQPEVDDASEAVHELPRLREDLLQAGLLRAETLSQLRMVRDAAEEERHKHLAEISAANMKVAQTSEQAAFTTELQASQLAQVTKELAEANDELMNWRTGNIRLANARQWREERSKTNEQPKSGSGSKAGSRSATPDMAGRMGSSPMARTPSDRSPTLGHLAE